MFISILHHLSVINNFENLLKVTWDVKTIIFNSISKAYHFTIPI